MNAEVPETLTIECATCGSPARVPSLEILPKGWRNIASVASSGGVLLVCCRSCEENLESVAAGIPPTERE
jgi:hypothetical protein